ncbi:VTT domain-containing protein [Paludicola sp. MB14-C6]|uniref:TVP38/TMEM64 family protein n=1 Tax=Paludihabitans sp. MB14-C6 TaxID=3070656 RepID=UPI0027DDB883|nr:VTT domain-containing protein [Paludicola sp. MB14-C6]WMJ22293.1 VTT domain-containing protein [Paludicola sp. MB14-C6]
MSKHKYQLKKLNKKDLLKLIIFIIVIVGMVALTIYLFPRIMLLKDQAGRDAFMAYIQSKGIWGVAILMGVQALQVVIAVIPGEPFEVLSGLVYGTWGGYFICTAGMLIGTIFIYYFVRVLGYESISKLFGEGKLENYKFMKNTKKLELFTFIFFFIPGTPKDFLTYFMPFTKIKPLTLFIIITIARIPSIISSTFAGSSISQGKWGQTIAIFAIIGIIAVVGIIFNEKLVDMLNNKREQMKAKRMKK